MLKPIETILSAESVPLDKAVQAELSAGIVDRLDVAVWVFDFDASRVIWANRSAFSVWSAGLMEELAARDLSADMSPAVARRFRQYQADFPECQDTVFTEMWTRYPKGVPRSMHARFRGVRLADRRIGMLCDGNQESSLLPEAVKMGIAMCKPMQVTIVAEGVEAEQAAQWVFRIGCQELQGYLFGMPMPAGGGARLSCGRSGRVRDNPNLAGLCCADRCESGEPKSLLAACRTASTSKGPLAWPAPIH